MSCSAQKTSNVSLDRDGSLALFENKSVETTIYVTREGNMGIGKKKPTDKLEVNGQIHAKSVKVDLQEWADDVFDKDYKLLSLCEIENHILQKGHLPEVPNTEEVLQNGINLGEMNTILLQKIEELTIHLITKDKEINALRQDLKKLSQDVESLKSQR